MRKIALGFRDGQGLSSPSSCVGSLPLMIMRVSITNKKDLGNGRHEVTLRCQSGPYGQPNMWSDEVVLVLPSSHRLVQDETVWVDTGQREPNGNPILKLETRPKSLEELTEYDLIEILASLTKRVHDLEKVK